MQIKHKKKKKKKKKRNVETKESTDMGVCVKASKQIGCHFPNTTARRHDHYE